MPKHIHGSDTKRNIGRSTLAFTRRGPHDDDDYDGDYDDDDDDDDDPKVSSSATGTRASRCS